MRQFVFYYNPAKCTQPVMCYASAMPPLHTDEPYREIRFTYEDIIKHTTETLRKDRARIVCIDGQDFCVTAREDGKGGYDLKLQTYVYPLGLMESTVPARYVDGFSPADFWRAE